jgi:hypothetical protein
MSTGNDTGGGGGSGTTGKGGSNSTTGGGGSSSTTGGGGSNSTTGGGGSTGSGSGGASADAGGDRPPMCNSNDMTTIPIDQTGFASAACNNFGIQGSWYCFDDRTASGTASSCVTGVAPFVSPGMCISGMTPTSTAAGVYGAAIGFELNATGGTASVKNAYNAMAHNVVGFEITITGSTGTGTNQVALRLAFTTGSSTTTTQPFVSLPGPGKYRVLFSDAVASTTVGASADNLRLTPSPSPTAIYDVQLFIPRQVTAVPYNFCITELKPILGPVSPPNSCGALAAVGNPVCGFQDVVTEVGTYAVQNNINGTMTGQCVQATSGGTCGGFTATFSNFGGGGNNPSSYPSIIYGWQNGSFYGGYLAAKKLSQINTVMTSWSFTPPSGNEWDAAYDIWLDASNPDPPKPAATSTELMVWLNFTQNQPMPNGGAAKATNVPIAGANWDVYQGNIGWNYVAYKRTATTSSFQNVDLMLFFNDAATRGYIQGKTSGSPAYLLGVQAGFEVWGPNQGGTASTTTFSVAAN